MRLTVARNRVKVSLSRNFKRKPANTSHPSKGGFSLFRPLQSLQVAFNWQLLHRFLPYNGLHVRATVAQREKR